MFIPVPPENVITGLKPMRVLLADGILKPQFSNQFALFVTRKRAAMLNCRHYGLAATRLNVHSPVVGVKVQNGLR